MFMKYYIGQSYAKLFKNINFRDRVVLTVTLRGVSERNGVRIGVPGKRSVDVPSVRVRNSCYVFRPDDMSEK
jgi:hypothetical protein